MSNKAPYTKRARAIAAQQATLDSVKHLRLLMAARILTIQWRRQRDGSFIIPPGARLALLAAIDESWDVVKGVTDNGTECDTRCATVSVAG